MTIDAKLIAELHELRTENAKLREICETTQRGWERAMQREEQWRRLLEKSRAILETN